MVRLGTFCREATTTEASQISRKSNFYTLLHVYSLGNTMYKPTHSA